jgi:hypothetical protein
VPPVGYQRAAAWLSLTEQPVGFAHKIFSLVAISYITGRSVGCQGDKFSVFLP